jgi:hypothetical protein
LKCVFSETLEPEPNQDPGSPYIKYRAYYGALDTTREGFYWPGSPSKRREYNQVLRQQPRTAAINYNGNMAGVGESVFNESDFRPYVPPDGLEMGIMAPEVMGWIQSMHGTVESAWDTALGQPQSESLTAALTGLLVPCNQWHKGEDPDLVGPCDFHYDVWLLWLMLKDLNFRELAMELRTQFGMWHPRRVTIEEKQSGVELLQTFKGTHIPVFGQKVQQGKLERATNAIMADMNGLPIPGGAASVQGWAKMGRVLYPAGAPWIEKGHDGSSQTGFLKRVCSFKGGTNATDEFDALIHLVTRAIVLSRRRITVGGEVDASQISPSGLVVPDSRREALDMIAQFTGGGMSSNPMAGFCMAPCSHYTTRNNSEYCDLHGRKTSAISGCSSFVEKR